MKDLRSFTYLLLFRVINSLLVQTQFNPDEFWQGPEIAHRMVFGYGYETWEWRERIRGYAHPSIYAAAYYVLKWTHLDTDWAVMYAPKFIHAILAAIADRQLYIFAERHGGPVVAKWTSICNFANWFVFYTITRSYSNSAEAVLTICALSVWPRNSNESSFVALCLAALATIVRPSSASFWIVPCLTILVRAYKKSGKNLVRHIRNTIVVSIVSISLMVAIDTIHYQGQLTFVPLNFLRFNVLTGGSEFYGAHPWYWYFVEGIPSIVGTMLPFLIWGIHTLYRQDNMRLLEWLLCALVPIVLLSRVAHKELRFILPQHYIFLTICGVGLTNLRFRYVKKLWFRILFYTIIVSNVIAAFYLCLVHQRGAIDVMVTLRQETYMDSVLFMGNCHMTPFHSHLHRDNVRMRILECPPPLKGESLETYTWEAREFLKSPRDFFTVTDLTKYSHIVTEDRYAEVMSDLINQAGLVEFARVFHSHVEEPHYYVLYRQI
eukprot:g447.t1